MKKSPPSCAGGAFRLPGLVAAAGALATGAPAAVQDSAPLATTPSVPAALPPLNTVGERVDGQRYDGGMLDVEDALAGDAAATPGVRTSVPGQYRDVTVRGRQRPAYDPLGLRIGGFRLFPRVGTDVGDDTNVFATSSGRNDVFVRPFGSLRAISNWGRHALSLDGDLSHRYYSRFGTEEGTEYRMAGAGRLDVVGRSALRGQVIQERVIVERANIGELPNTWRPLRYTQTFASGNGTAETGRLLTTLTGSYTDRDYSDNALLDRTPLDLSFRNYRMNTGRVDVAYSVSGAQSVFLSAEVDRRKFNNTTGTIGFDSKGLEVLGGIRGEVTPVIRGQIGFGVLRQDFRNSAADDASGLAIDTRIEWLPTRLTTATFTARRQLETSAIRTDLSYIATRLRSQVDHELLRNVLLLASVSYDTADYRSSTRKDHLLRSTVGADYLANRNLRAGVRLLASRRTSNDPSRPNFSDLSITATFSYGL